MQKWGTLTDRSLKLVSLLISVALLIAVAPRSYASNILLDARFDRISTPVAGAGATHNFGFRMTQTSTPVGSIRFTFCSNSPIIGDPCTAPIGLNASSALLSSQSGEMGFSISSFSTASSIILTRPASLPTGIAAEYRFDSIVNPTSEGSYYVRLETFTSTDATGANIEQGGVVFAINSAVNLTAIVPPYLKFCASVTITAFDCSTANSYLIDLGEFSTSRPSAASSELVVATNAAYGYSVSMNGTTLTSGNTVIPALLPGSASNSGTSQFGVNLRSNSSPSIGADPQGPGIGAAAGGYGTPNLFRFQNGDTIISSGNASDNQKFTVSYMTNISSAQAAGYYATTLTYICLANF